MEKELHDLIEACLANDRKAQEQLYRQLYGFTMAIALRYVRDEMDADDIVSKAFVKLFRSIHLFDREKGSLHAWLKRITINEALNQIKQHEKFVTVALEGTDEPGINNAATERIDANEVIALIRQLPPATHAVFVLYIIEGYAHNEIAELLNINQGTSKWHLNAARKILKNKLSNHNKK